MNHKKRIISILNIIYCLIALPGALLTLGYIFYAVSWWGISAALAVLAILLLPVTQYFTATALSKKSRSLLRRIGICLCSYVAIATAVIIITTPTGYAASPTQLSQRFTTGSRFPRYAISNIVPEIEQVNIGFLVMPLLDNHFSHEQVNRVRPITINLYRAMEDEARFREVGSAMGWAYLDLLGKPFDTGHYYLYLPQNHNPGPLPAIVFLHGSVGNFKAYTWVWSHLAEELGTAIISPSFGFGNWDNPGGTRTTLNALEDAQTIVDLDEDRIYLAGLSNGGLGVSQIASSNPERFHGLVFLSPVMTAEIVDNADFQEQWRDRPVLVITGEADERIPKLYVNERVEHLVRGGVDVTYIVYSGEDHFLFFSQWENVLKDISYWLIAK